MKQRDTRVRTVVAVVTLGIVLTAPAATAEWGGFGPGQLSVWGAGVSQGEDGGYGLGVKARTTGEAEDAGGQFRFGEDGPDGKRGIAGEVNCLSRDADGLIRVSGTIFANGHDEASGDAAGKDFAATIDVDSEPQRFSEITIGEAGTLAPCGGGGESFHALTEGGYRAGSW